MDEWQNKKYHKFANFCLFLFHKWSQYVDKSVHFETCTYIFQYSWWFSSRLTHWGRATHICVGKLTIIGSDNGLSPGRRQAIIRINAGILLIRPFGTNFSEFLVEILIVSFKKMRLKVSSAKRRPFCLRLNELDSLWASDTIDLGQHWFR